MRKVQFWLLMTLGALLATLVMLSIIKRAGESGFTPIVQHSEIKDTI